MEKHKQVSLRLRSVINPRVPGGEAMLFVATVPGLGARTAGPSRPERNYFPAAPLWAQGPVRPRAPTWGRLGPS